MADLIIKTPGEPDDVLKKIKKELDSVLERKRRDVAWKIESVKKGFKKYVLNHKD